MKKSGESGEWNGEVGKETDLLKSQNFPNFTGKSRFRFPRESLKIEP